VRVGYYNDNNENNNNNGHESSVMPKQTLQLLRESEDLETIHYTNTSQLIADCRSFHLLWMLSDEHCVDSAFYERFREECSDHTVLIVEQNELCRRPLSAVGLALPVHSRLRANLFLDLIQQFQMILDTGQQRDASTGRRVRAVQHVAILHDYYSQIGKV